MEQIIIKRGNTLIPLASKKTATSIKSATQNVALLGDDTLNIVVVSPFKLDFLIGDTTFVYGNIYKLNRLPKVKKNGMYEFEYELEFEGAQYDMMRVTYDLTIDTTSNQLADVSGDSLTGNLRRFATVMVSNLNRVFKNMWELGECPDTAEDKTLTFSESENCLSVIQNLCKEFETEFEVLYSGYSWKYTINFKKIGKTFPYKFEFGKNNGLYQLTRENVSTSNIVTRLKVYGSTENITAKYRAQRLCLPNRSKRDSYIEDAAAVKKYGIWEARKYFDDIKPSRTGKVEKIFSDSVLKFVDSTMFDLNEKDESGNTKYLLAETSAKVHFNTGNLAGYEFEVHSYDHATHTFTLKKQTDERGNVFPSESTPAFRFSVKDEYKLIDIALPQSYIDEAESELAKQGRTYYNQNSQPKVQYGLSVTDSFLASMLSNETNGNVIWVGDYIPVKDSDVDVDKSVRVKSFKRDLMKDYSYTLTISDMSITSSITNRVVSELIEHDKAISINQLLDPARARANWRSSREVLNMVFDPDGDYYTDKIKPASIDTMALSVGAKAMQFGLQNTVFQPNYLGKANRIVYKGGVLTHYTIKEESAVSWILADGDVTLKNENAYYIYAKCSKKDNSGSIIFSQSQIKTNEDVGYYHFFIGVLNSVDSELKARSLALTYGFTMINGRFIKTGRIESADGTTYFDLDNSEIGGRIVFTQNGQKKTLEEIAAETLENKNYINNTLPGILDGFTKQIDGKIETWYQESDPSTNWKNEEKDAHVGDLWYNTKTNEAKRYSSKLAWETIKDADAIKALQDASKAQDTADGKRRVFVATPTTPYDVGDLWTDGKDLKRCIKAKSSGNFVDSDWGLATNYTGDESLNDFIENTYNSTISDIMSQLDGVIETHFGNGIPTLSNEPAKNWNTNALKENHLGDMYYDNDSGIGYRFSKEGSTYKWSEVRDTGVASALEAASRAQDTADGKRRVFVATPTPPYDEGDLWASGTFLKRCINSRTSGRFLEGDWDLATNYTGDESLNAFVDGLFDSTVSDIYNQLDGKLESWYTSTDPSSKWGNNDKPKHVGDQWFNTSSNRLYHYTKNGTKYEWNEIKNQDAINAASAASKAQDTADGKRRVFVSTPTTPYDVGDLWTQGASGDLMRCKVARASGKYSSSDWERAVKYTDDSALTKFINGVYNSTIENLTSQIDGKVESWFQENDPSDNWSEPNYNAHLGDMWYNPKTKDLCYWEFKRYASNGHLVQMYVWTKVEDRKAIEAYEAASKAQDTADGKRTVFVAEPKPPYQIGDLWVDGKELRRCVTARSSGTYVATDWAIAVYYDNTKTTIDGGIVTSGTIQVAGDKKYILAGITGKGSSGDSIRFWAGTTFENRSIAPFRVQQNGKVYMKDAVVEGEINSIIGNIGRWILSDGIIKSKASIDEKAKVKIPAIQLDSINGKILIGENIVLDKLGLSLISNNYEKLRVSNCQIGEYSKYLVAQKHTGEEHLYFNVPGGYIFVSRTWIPKYIKPEVAKVHFGYFGAGTVLTINQIDILKTVPKPNVQGISVGMRFNGAPSVICTLRCNGVSVAQTSTYYGGAKMSGESFSMQMKWAKTFIIDKSNEGDYELEIAVQPLDIYASSGTCAIGKTQGLITVDFDFTRGSYERTVIANDGLMSCWKDGVMMMTNAGFIVNFGSYHLKITKEGIKKSTDSGVNWKDV